MPVYKIRGPDGKLYRYRVDAKDANPDEVLESFNQQYALRSAISAFEPPKKQAGFFGSFKDAITTLGLTDEAAVFAANPTEENRQAFLKAAESKYKSIGGFGKGDNWQAFKELLGGSLGALVAPIAGGVAGAAAGPLGAIGGFTGVSGAQYGIQNLRRQAEEQQAAAEAGEAVPELSLGKAAVAAGAQAGLDIVPGALILKGLSKFPIAQRLLTQDKSSSKAADVLIDAFNKGNVSLKGNIAKGIGLGVAFEVPQEIAQQALERWQAGLSLTDDEAKEEFKQAAIGAAILGGGFGAIGGYSTYRGEQAQRDKEQAEIEESLFGAPSASDTGIPAEFYEQDRRRQRRESNDIARSLIDITSPVESGVPYEFYEQDVLDEENAQIEAQRQANLDQLRDAESRAYDLEETEAEREARLEREAIQELSREKEEEKQTQLTKSKHPQYSARTLREAAEAEALAPREENEDAPYFPPKEDEGDELFGKIDAPASTEGVLEGLGAPTEGGIPADMLAPTPREIALEVIKTTPTIKAIAQATGLNQPKAAALMRQFVSEGIVEQRGNKFKVITPEAPTKPEATDVSSTAPATETDRGTDRGSTDLFTLGPPAGELGAPPTGGAGLDTTGDVTERIDDRETDVPGALEEVKLNAQISPGRDVAGRSVQERINNKIDTLPEKFLKTLGIDMSTPEGIQQAQKLVSGPVDANYQIAIDPLSWAGVGTALKATIKGIEGVRAKPSEALRFIGLKSRGEKIKDKYQFLAERGNVAAGMDFVFKQPDVVKLWDDELGPVVRNFANAKTSQEKADLS